MPLQDQNQNQLREIAQALRRRLWQVLLPGAVFLSLAYALATLMPKTYTAQTTLELRESTIPIGGQGFDATAIQRDVTNTPWQIKQFERVRRVLEKLEWPEYTTLAPMEQAEFVRDTILDIMVATPFANPNKIQGSTQIVIAYKNTDPQRAEQFVNRLRDAYTSEVLDRYRTDAKKALEVLRNQMQVAPTKRARRTSPRPSSSATTVSRRRSKRRAADASATRIRSTRG
jgi:capsular polysaccharide biosynthesis protein